MTAPEYYDGLPDFLPWSGHNCRVCKCTLVVTNSLYGGKRCAAHPDQFDPDVLLRLRLDGWVDTADAYVRYWNSTEPSKKSLPPAPTGRTEQHGH